MSLDVPATLVANQKRVNKEARLSKGKDRVVDKMAQQLLKNASPEDKKRVEAAAKKRATPIKVHVDDAVRKRMLGGSVPAVLAPHPTPKHEGDSGRYWPDPTYLSTNRPGSAMSAARNKMFKKRKVTWSSMIGGPKRALLQGL